jgi:hypothetical protein
LKLKVLFCWITFAGVLFAQKPTGPLTNQKVGDLVVAGVSTSEVIRIISAAPSVSFDLRPGSTDNLLNAGVSEEIIKAMAARESGAAVAPAPHQAPNARLSYSPPTNSFSKSRVFVQDANDSWSFSATRHSSQGSTHPQTVEVIKTLSESCPSVVVTNNPEKADYRVEFERESGKLARRHNKFAAFNRGGDLVYADSTRALGNAVRGFCASIQQPAAPAPLP